MSQRLDVLVVGSGVAGLSAAVRLAHVAGARVGVLTKGELEQTTTRWAQGGVAAVLPGDEDSTDLHLADTLRAGAGLCDEAAVRVLVDEGPARVHELIALGAVFDRGPAGDLARAREGGHSMARVLHAGGAATGAEVERALVAAVESSAAALFEHFFALDLVVEGGRCGGVTALDRHGGLQRVEAAEVVLAAGGAGQLFAVTTNPAEATGDGIAMAMRAGVPVADCEFVQFHPTALHHPAMPRPLVSEALRGHGAVLRGENGRRFVEELAPRDVVSRAIAEEMAETGRENVWLDCTGLEDFARRFPTIHASLAGVGLDPARDWLPVAPAAHHLSGGVLTDLDGATAMPGLWAAGEAACTGVHGANRLASNSLLEGMVFGARVVDAIVSGRSGRSPAGRRARGGALSDEATVPLEALPDCDCGAPLPVSERVSSDGELMATLRLRLQTALTANAGVVRDAVSLKAAEQAIAEVAAAAPGGAATVAEAELANLLALGRSLVEAATLRQESRGAHTRADFPETSSGFRKRFVHCRRAQEGRA
ncbi:MAG TPA: L-aspartate oxidase [Acidimicrobiales bacterium]|nr:L-aspartate oxidase [Acidimicrobiales bacterium]